jgi:hypothetical protein
MRYVRRFIERDDPDPDGRSNDYSSVARKRHIGSTAPAVEDAPAVLRDRIAALAAKGALDEGSGAFFDRMIASWVEQWHNDIDNEHEARQSELQLEAARIRAELTRRQTFEESTQGRLAELNLDIAELRASPRQRDPAPITTFLTGLTRRWRTRGSTTA